MARVLLIEDHAVIRRLIEVSVLPLDIELVSCGDGVRGLEAIDAQKPDLVLVDIGLPGIDGWEVIERIRKKHSFRELPILVVTVHGTYEDELHAMGLSVNGFIAKPFHPDELLQAVDRLLKGSLSISDPVV